MLSVDIGTSFNLAISHNCTWGGRLKDGINVAEVATEKLEGVDRNVLFCCRGGLLGKKVVGLGQGSEVLANSVLLGGWLFCTKMDTRALAEQQERKVLVPPLSNQTCHHRVAS